jgi:hypothetical protein
MQVVQKLELYLLQASTVGEIDGIAICGMSKAPREPKVFFSALARPSL